MQSSSTFNLAETRSKYNVRMHGMRWFMGGLCLYFLAAEFTFRTLTYFPQVPAFVRRPGTPHLYTTTTPHYISTYRVVSPREKRCGVVWLWCLVFGRRLALVGQHRDDGGSHVYTRSSAIADGPRDATFRSNSCQLLHSSVGTTSTTSPDQICAGGDPGGISQRSLAP